MTASKKKEMSPSQKLRPRTWMATSIENLVLRACMRAEGHTARVYDSSPNTNEERFTGTFFTRLQSEFDRISPAIERRARDVFGGYTRFSCVYQDVAAKGPEKIWGADAGLLIDVDVANTIKFRRGILVQIKKADPAVGDSWKIEPRQRDQLSARSPFSIYLLLGGSRTGTGAHVIPTATIYDLLEGTKRKAQLTAKTVATARSFSEFFTYEFVADWWGDRQKNVIDLIADGAENFAVRWLFSVALRVGYSSERE